MFKFDDTILPVCTSSIGWIYTDLNSSVPVHAKRDHCLLNKKFYLVKFLSHIFLELLSGENTSSSKWMWETIPKEFYHCWNSWTPVTLIDSFFNVWVLFISSFYNHRYNWTPYHLCHVKNLERHTSCKTR